MVGRAYARRLTILAAGALAIGLAVSAAASAGVLSHAARAGQAHRAASCVLGPTGAVRHVIYLQFDNVHYTRDNRNVPSDLQQMPNLLNFITGHGTLVTHEHTPLTAHTADDIVTSESGLYGSGQGVPVANTYRYYKPDGMTDTAGSFAYWADPMVDYNTNLAGTPVGDHNPTMINSAGRMTPAPWVSYARAG